MNRIKGIDSLRMVCALTVLVGHIGLPVPDSKLITSILGVLFNGPAAVIVFFIISGFCIHYPNTTKKKVNIYSFYIRRFLRIAIPAILAFMVWKWVGVIAYPPNYGVFWSVICELMYYLLYPLFFVINKKLGWGKQIAIAYSISYLLALMNLDLLKYNQDYTALPHFTWIIGLPCWLLGCWLAENYKRFSAISFTEIWLIRIGITIVSIILLVVKFHANPPFSSYIITLNIFAIFCCIWIGTEIVYFGPNDRKPSKILEWGGKWSYSLYIIHPAAGGILNFFHVPALSDNNIKILEIITAIVFSYSFYLIVENPSHLLAKKVAGYFTKMPKKVTV